MLSRRSSMENNMEGKSCKDCIHKEVCGFASGVYEVFTESEYPKPCCHFRDKERTITLPCELGELIPVRYKGDNCKMRATSVIVDDQNKKMMIELRDGLKRLAGRYTFHEIESLIETGGEYIDKDIAKLNPCKECGSTDIRISKSVNPFLETTIYAAYCYHCGTGTRESQIKNVVIRLWNKMNK